MKVDVARYPQLRLLCWSRPGVTMLKSAEAFALYERGWRHVDEGALTADERALIDDLAARHGGGVLLTQWRLRGPAVRHGPHEPGDEHGPHHGHPHVLAVLRALDADLLREAGCVLSGDAAAVLALDGYRALDGVTLACASQDGLCLLRTRLLAQGARALFRDGAVGEGRAVQPLREPHADPWGLRLVVAVGGQPITVEVVRATPPTLAGEPDPALAALGLPVRVPGRAELFRERLLSNADRHADPTSFNRDAIDLALMADRWGPVPEEAWEGARAAYGTAVVDSAYAGTVATLRDPAWLARCLDGLGIDLGLAPAVLALPDAPPKAQDQSADAPHEGRTRT